MAIDYTGFGQSRGGAVGQTLGQGFAQIAANLPSPEERTQERFSKYFNKLDMSMNPVFEVSADGTMSYKGVANQSGDFSTENFKVKTLTEAWNDYVNTLETKGLKLRPDEYSRFAEMYQAKSSEWGMNLANKFERMKNAGLSKTKIRKMISGNPELLQNLSKVSALSPESYASIQDYLVPGKALIPSAFGNLGNLAMAASPMGLAAAMRGGQAAWSAPKGKGLEAARKAALTRMVPGLTSLDRVVGASTNKEIAKMVRDAESKVKSKQLKSGEYKRWGAKASARKQKLAEKKLKTSEKSVKTITKQVDDLKVKNRKEWTKSKKAWQAKQKNPKAQFARTGKGAKGINTFKYKGKTYKTAGGMEREVKAAESQLDKAKKAVKSAQKNVKISYKPATTASQQLKSIQAFTKKHGTSKLISEVYKKLGWKGIAKLGTKGTLSLLCKAGAGVTAGISGAASLALDAWTIASIYQVVKDVAAESGGLRRPDKMLFGGEDSSGARGASY